MPPGFIWRIIVTFVVSIAWMLVIFLYPEDIIAYPELVMIGSILVGAVICSIWIHWYVKVFPRYVGEWKKYAEGWARGWERKPTRRRRAKK